MDRGLVTPFHTGMSLTTRSGSMLAAIVLLAALVRLAATAILSPALTDDALSYFVMASGWVATGEWRDAFGQHAFFSAGYPMLLVPFFALFGASAPVAIAANLSLAAIATFLVHRIARMIGGREDAALLTALGCALWLPGIWNATGLAKENLSTGLLLALAWSALRIARGIRPLASAIAGGLAWGGGRADGRLLPVVVRGRRRRVDGARATRGSDGGRPCLHGGEAAGAGAVVRCDEADGRTSDADHERRVRPLSRQQSRRERSVRVDRRYAARDAKISRAARSSPRSGRMSGRICRSTMSATAAPIFPYGRPRGGDGPRGCYQRA